MHIKNLIKHKDRSVKWCQWENYYPIGEDLLHTDYLGNKHEWIGVFEATLGWC